MGRKPKAQRYAEQNNESHEEKTVVTPIAESAPEVQPTIVEKKPVFNRYCIERKVVGTAIALRGAFPALRSALGDYKFSDYELGKVWQSCNDLHNAHVNIEPDTIHANLMSVRKISMSIDTIIHFQESGMKTIDEAMELAKSLLNEC